MFSETGALRQHGAGTHDFNKVAAIGLAAARAEGAQHGKD